MAVLVVDFDGDGDLDVAIHRADAAFGVVASRLGSRSPSKSAAKTKTKSTSAGRPQRLCREWTPVPRQNPEGLVGSEDREDASFDEQPWSPVP